MGNKIKVGITMGDINGIGAEIIIKALADERILELFTPVVYGSTRVAAHYRKECGLPALQFNLIDDADDADQERINIINVVADDIKIEPGVATKQAGEAAFTALERAVADLRSGAIDTLVTAPIDKDTIQSATFTFPGHTEYLEASLAEDEHDKAMMMMVAGDLRIALVTAHIPLSKVPQEITREKIADTLRRLNSSLTEDFGISSPRIAVLSLNPHAGENGLLGNEEKDEIIPAINDVSDCGILAFGPYAADGFFGSGAWHRFDGVLAMYHDQGLAPFKTIAMEAGVNFTAGLPAVRTSPDHGTAFDIAGKGIASEASMRQALYLATDIIRNRRRHASFTSNPLKKQVVEKPRKPKSDKDIADKPSTITENQEQ